MNTEIKQELERLLTAQCGLIMQDCEHLAKSGGIDLDAQNPTLTARYLIIAATLRNVPHVTHPTIKNLVKM